MIHINSGFFWVTSQGYCSRRPADVKSPADDAVEITS